MENGLTYQEKQEKNIKLFRDNLVFHASNVSYGRLSKNGKIESEKIFWLTQDHKDALTFSLVVADGIHRISFDITEDELLAMVERIKEVKQASLNL